MPTAQNPSCTAHGGNKALLYYMRIDNAKLCQRRAQRYMYTPPKSKAMRIPYIVE